MDSSFSEGQIQFHFAARSHKIMLKKLGFLFHQLVNKPFYDLVSLIIKITACNITILTGGHWIQGSHSFLILLHVDMASTPPEEVKWSVR